MIVKEYVQEYYQIWFLYLKELILQFNKKLMIKKLFKMN